MVELALIERQIDSGSIQDQFFQTLIGDRMAIDLKFIGE